MHPDLEKLVQLQKADTELKRVETALLDVPRQKGSLDAQLAEEKSRLDKAKEALAQSQKSRRHQEGELQDLESKRSKYQGQLTEVKTNKEYTALLHERETVEREIRAREDQILLEMERAETLQADVKREEGLFKSAEERHRGDAKALEERGRALEGELQKLRREREELAKGLADELLARYARVARLRGSAVAEARDEMCQLCHVKLRPQMYMDIKRNDGILECPSCSRILYFEPPVPVAAQHP
jgi:predicted  nucleic acid-binding Zn-ribbon protein